MNSECTFLDVPPRDKARPPRTATAGLQKVRVFEVASGLLLGHTADINSRGMRVVSGSPIPRGQPFRLWMEVFRPKGERIRALLDAQSVWTESLPEASAFETGFRITDVTPEAAAGIESLMRDLPAGP